MFIDDLSAQGSTPVAESPHWSILVTADFVALGATHYHADLFLWDEWTCRLSLRRQVVNRTQAVHLLTEQCRNWIARRENRPRIGDTDFRVLCD